MNMDQASADEIYRDRLPKLIQSMADIAPDSSNLIVDDFEKTIDSYPQNVAFWFEGTESTYSEFEARANQFAHWGIDQGLQIGDCVALFMVNQPDYIAFWFGMAKIGVVTALINSNLSGRGLAHCIKVADAKTVIISAELDNRLETAMEHLPDTLSIWSHGRPVPGLGDLDAAIAKSPITRVARRGGVVAGDTVLYIYTSGTTGLPKAARIPHTRAQGVGRTFLVPSAASSNDRTYVALPLYHATGGLCAVGLALYSGGTIVLRRKFSASQFWAEVKASGATMFAYIGELGRYLMNQPVSPGERGHQLRLGFGNGMRAEVWRDLLDRTGIDQLIEFYGSTEGVVTFLNLDGHIGAVGRIPPWMEEELPPVKVVKYDVETEQIVRGPDGYCIEAEFGEPGEAVGKIIGETPIAKFEGYKDKSATQKKILSDAFEQGDAWFRTGDLMSRDAEGYFYFVDRIGDTFRWKSENVSTNEVGDVISRFPGVELANVYGVSVPGREGKAGMAALTIQEDFLLTGLRDHLVANLPSYARPLFLRIQTDAETTGTLKYRKVDLVRDGFDPGGSSDAFYFDDVSLGRYVPIDGAVLEKLRSGAMRL